MEAALTEHNTYIESHHLSVTSIGHWSALRGTHVILFDPLKNREPHRQFLLNRIAENGLQLALKGQKILEFLFSFLWLWFVKQRLKKYLLCIIRKGLIIEEKIMSKCWRGPCTPHIIDES